MCEQQWYFYLIETKSGSLYTGITTDVSRRFSEHQANGPKTARSLRGKGPLTLRFQQRGGDKSNALKLEYRIKRLARPKKLALIAETITVAQLWPELTPP
ncbi:GIY-YIG nuclease family protein [uncultured Ferrimonas sp.]|uniref:GIY-YIG nuclease family protein n=1 Tax=uncultured Ferrimonas sp. TaxID=432640 RepID=UPI0026248ADD|nr:GIY-YIG nuclease family protein [uncultured Ferrimonas sp.]